MSRSSAVPTMRPPDPPYPDYYLLEEISKPQACLSAGRISIWVYHDDLEIREVVVAGHAESVTCASATSILIETAKQFDSSVSWMLTCGAAYFRVPPGSPAAQANLRQMIQALQEVADEKGLVEIFHQDWQRLLAFRERFRYCAGASPAHIVVPTGESAAQVIDYAAILPRNANGSPLTFRLEGWDFDCPAFQSVADRHLRKLRLELLRDALRRRRTYRVWLKEWTEDWVRNLGWLQQHEAARVGLEVPPATNAEPESVSTLVAAEQFFDEHAASFLDRGQQWHKELGYAIRQMPYGRASEAELNKAIRPTTITVVDFQRLQRSTRAATEEDGTFTMRQRITRDDPGMISSCLEYIRTMDRIIAPYEELRPGREGAASREVRLVEEISKQIVMETMIRGWPSVYLDDKADRAAFAAWSDEYRPHVWKIMATQAKAQGVALEILLEDNVVYDVRFDDDLGCIIQPLMLLDDATYAQLHGSGQTGASVAIPLWPRRTPQSMPASVLNLAPTNRERAAELVRDAVRQPNPGLAAEKLRQALACHPGEGGKHILREWWRRLGRDTSAEFEAARSFIEAAKLMQRQCYADAKTAIETHFDHEPRPLPDAYVIAALAGMHHDEEARAEMRKGVNDYERLARRHDDLAEKLRNDQARGYRLPAHEIEMLKAIQREVERLTTKLNTLRATIEKETEEHRALIGKALNDAGAVRRKHPALALAATHAAAALKETLDNDCAYHSGERVLIRYGDVRLIIEARGLLDIIYALLIINHRIEKEPNEARRRALDEMQRLTTALWLPDEVESDLRQLHEEFVKGDWDRLQSMQILSIIRGAMSTCHSRMSDRLSSQVITRSPLKETIATRIHITQILESKYKVALDMLIGSDVAFGIAIDAPWTILNDKLEEWPDDGRFVFDAEQGIVSIEAGGQRTSLLQAEGISASDRAFVEETIADESLPRRLNRFAASIAEALLAMQVAPRREWRDWSEALMLIQIEMIAALSGFGDEANLMPDHAPPTIDSGEDFETRWNRMVPRTYPKVDRAWRQLGAWEKLAGPACDRSELAF